MTFDEKMAEWYGRKIGAAKPMLRGAPKALADKIGIAEGTMSTYRSGQRPGDITLAKIAKVLGVPIEEAEAWWPSSKYEVPALSASTVREPSGLEQRVGELERQMKEVQQQLQRMARAEAQERRRL